MESDIKKIVAPQKQSNGKTYWNTIGIMGIKNGKVWLRINMIPTGWDGYCMAVEQRDAGARKAGAEGPAGGEGGDGGASQGGFDPAEGPGF